MRNLSNSPQNNSFELDNVKEIINGNDILKGLIRTLNTFGITISVSFDDHTFMSKYIYPKGSSRVKIIIGRGKMGNELKENIFYKHWDFSEEDVLEYKLIHELSHIIIESAPNRQRAVLNSVETLFNAIYDIRKKINKGLTSLGNMDFYKEKHISDPFYYLAKEDLVELIAMRIYDEKYFKEYIMMLQENSTFKKNLNLSTLSPGAGNFLQKHIEKIIEF